MNSMCKPCELYYSFQHWLRVKWKTIFYDDIFIDFLVFIENIVCENEIFFVVLKMLRLVYWPVLDHNGNFIAKCTEEKRKSIFAYGKCFHYFNYANHPIHRIVNQSIIVCSTQQIVFLR